MPESHSPSRGRKSPGDQTGASSGAASREQVRPEELQLIEAVVARENLLQAYSQVMRHQGAAGVHTISVEQLKPYLQTPWAQTKEALLNGTYQPQPVGCVEIAKPPGGMRQLGIPPVVDRLLQPALPHVLSPVFEPGFSESSYGYRPERRAPQAVKQAGAMWEKDGGGS